MKIAIHPLTTMEEAEEVAEVQRQAWKMDDIGIVPTFETKAVSDVGFVYVAKDAERVVGFIYGYHHFPDVHYSHMMAVLPEYQSKDIGYRLKQYHRDEALQSEHPVLEVQWTVDPLLPNNAYLNFAKLGGYCDTYKINYYGDPSSDGVEIYAGVPTDRFKLTWPIHSSRVTRRMENYLQDRISPDELLNRSPTINIVENNKCQVTGDIEGESFSVEVPANYQEIRQNNVELALDWRIQFRDICVSALDQGYIVYDYHSYSMNSSRTNYYEFRTKDTISDF